jgi:hypothetical protein
MRALVRWGGILVQPRATVRALGTDEGARDGWWLGALYLVGTSAYALAEALATLVAVRNLGGVLAVAMVLGRGLLPPILVLVVAETVLGRARAHRRGLALVPLVVVGAATHAARQLGHAAIDPVMAAVVAGLLGVGLVWWVRAAVEPLGSEGSS